MGFQLGNL